VCMFSDNKEKNVKVWQAQETIVTYDMGDYNPLAKFHGVIPQTRLTYPLQHYGSQQRRKIDKEYTMSYLENKYLKLSVCKELGGRLWQVFDKISGHDLFLHNNAVKPYNGGTGHGYTGGGMEVNLPDAHSVTNIRPREVQIKSESDGSASIIISEWERTRRLRWSYAFTLYPDTAYIEQSVRVQNHSAFPVPWKYWANAAVEATDKLQVIFPEPRAIRHGSLPDEFSWPRYGNIDISWWKNLSEVLGLYMYDVKEGFFGYYNYDYDMGMVHYSDPYLLPGKKYWSWGNNQLGKDRRSQLTGNQKAYVEIQSGRIENQDQMEMLRPFQQTSWSERWYPIHKIGSFCNANNDVAVSIKLNDKNGQKNTKLSVGIATPVLSEQVFLEIKFKNKVLHTCQQELTPEKPILCDKDCEITEDQLHYIQVQVCNKNGKCLIAASPKKPVVDRGDLLVVPEELQHKNPKTENENFHMSYFSEVLNEGYSSAQGYTEILNSDPNHIEALLGMARWEAKAGNLTSALARLKKVIGNDQYTCEAYGYIAKLYELKNDIENSKIAYNKLVRYGSYREGYCGLGCLAMKEKEFQTAADLFALAIQYDANDSRLKILRSFALSSSGKRDDAISLLDQVLQRDPSNIVAKFQLYLMNKQTPLEANNRVDDIKEQLQHSPDTFVELALEYANVGLYELAIEVLEQGHKSHAIILFYLGYYSHCLTYKDKAKNYFEKACSASKEYIHPNRIESINVFEIASKYLPKASAPYYYKGCIHAAYCWQDGALETWEKAEELGEKYYGLYRNIAVISWKLKGDVDTALRYYEKAVTLAPKSPYLIDEYCDFLNQQQLDEKFRSVLELDWELTISNYTLFTKLINLYGRLGEFEMGEKALREADFSLWWEEPLSMAYQRFYILKGLEYMNQEKYPDAIASFEAIFCMPVNLGYTRSTDLDDQRAWYLIGICYEKMGKSAEAEKIWQKAIDINYKARWDVGEYIRTWRSRFYQALCLQKLGQWNQATVYLDGLKEYTLSKKRGSDVMMDMQSQIALICLARRTDDILKDESQIQVSTQAVEMRTVDVET
jgi:tetratricopeptide (TPR) repeat protein